jgi:murein DD-endopeptidase MepM/ murein hydrolase activator NlpD
MRYKSSLPIKIAITGILTFNILYVFAQLDDKIIYDLKSGRIKNDSSYIYTLPYQKGKSIFLVQAYNSNMSHKNELSLDFKMRQGTKICAARSGVVIALKEDSNEGGLKDEYLSKGNHIIIQHIDGSKAIYWHLQQNGVVVNTGDTVQQGQLIGFSGNTGYTAFPHLHFQVKDKNGREIAVRFATKKGNIYLRPAHWYKAIRDS